MEQTFIGISGFTPNRKNKSLDGTPAFKTCIYVSAKDILQYPKDSSGTEVL
jgi:hypothetical protein